MSEFKFQLNTTVRVGDRRLTDASRNGVVVGKAAYSGGENSYLVTIAHGTQLPVTDWYPESVLEAVDEKG